MSAPIKILIQTTGNRIPIIPNTQPQKESTSSKRAQDTMEGAMEPPASKETRTLFRHSFSVIQIIKKY